jgi:hypothetical protein
MNAEEYFAPDASDIDAFLHFMNIWCEKLIPLTPDSRLVRFGRILRPSFRSSSSIQAIQKDNFLRACTAADPLTQAENCDLGVHVDTDLSACLFVRAERERAIEALYS